MRNILMLLSLVVPLVSNSQRKVIFDTTIVNTTSKDFFERNIVVDSISFSPYYRQPRFLYVYPKTIWFDTSYNQLSSYNSEYYNYEFLGDRYLFEKKYSGFQLPEKEKAMILANSCDPNPSIRIVARLDSIRFIMQSYCRVQSSDDGKKANGKDDEDKIFEKVEVGPGYKNGIGVLQNKIETAFRKRHFENENYNIDSVLIFEITVDRLDSCLKRIMLIEGSYSGFAQFIMDELKTNCGWKAGIASGRPVTSYLKIFFRLNKDKSITVAI